MDNDIPKLPKTIKTRLQKVIETRLAIDPIGLGKPLRYSFKGHRRIHVGDYRLVYRVQLKKQIVIIVYIRHRKDIYKSHPLS